MCDVSVRLKGSLCDTATHTSLRHVHSAVQCSSSESHNVVLLHSFADHRLHEFFQEREYPDTSVLAKIHALLSTGRSSSSPYARPCVKAL